MKKLLQFAMAFLIGISLVSCGSEATDIRSDENSVSITEPAPQVQDFIAFFDDIKPYKDNVVERANGQKYRIMEYTINVGSTVLIEQYIDNITSGDYGIELVETSVNELSSYYYLKYTGDSENYFGDSYMNFHINIAVDIDKLEAKAGIRLTFADGIEFVDDGYRTDYSKVEFVPAPTPKPTPTPQPTATPRPTPKPTSAPTAKPAPAVETVDKNASYIPDFTAFLNRSPSEDKDRYYGGNRKYYQKLSLDTQSAVVSEVLNLLDSDRYQLELIEKVDANDRIEYNYRYTGNVSMDSIHSKNDDSRYYNLQFTVYNKNNDNGTYGIHFHYSPQFTEENVGYTVSQVLSGGSGGGGNIAEFEPNDIPDHSKLPCLTCDGDGDCTKCGGSTYVYYGGARAKCDRCRGTGDCRTCGGSGTRN